jgi:hypothetical protein
LEDSKYLGKERVGTVKQLNAQERK